ncbi:Histone-lysine N-methyltransferase ATX3 [Linum perenne]
MIIKKNMKAEVVPKLRRCKVEEAYNGYEEEEEEEEEDYAYSFVPKRQKIDGYGSNGRPSFYSDVDDFSSATGSGGSEGSCVAVHMGLNLKSLRNQALKRSQPPAFRTSRGRTHSLPSRFNDSVGDLMNNVDGRFYDDIDSSFDIDDFVTASLDDNRRKMGFVNENFNNHSSPFAGKNRGAGAIQLSNHNKHRKYERQQMNLDRSMLGAVDSGLRFERKVLQKFKTDKAGIRKDIYRPEEFSLGDVVWARSGKRFPWWPAVVIDPILQAPEAVLSCCVPGALCVMFYGYSKNGRQRGAGYKEMRCCDDCNLMLPCKVVKKLNGSVHENELLCDHCAKLRKANQYCGICNKIWRHSDCGNWVCCDGCNVWIHAECDNISKKHLKDLENNQYYCPDCRLKFKSQSLDHKRRMLPVKYTLSSEEAMSHEKVTVVCNAMEGTYFLKFHSIVCSCGTCGSRKQTPSEWEKHTGCKAKKWKCSIKVKDTTLLLEKWIAEHSAHCSDLLELDKQKLLTYLQGGALKPTDVDNLWVHITCAWFRPQVGFLNHEKMEPATGFFRIPSATFLKVHCVVKNGKEETRKLIYCAVHRTPNPDSVVAVCTPAGIFAAKSLLQNQNEFFRGSRLVSSRTIEHPETSTSRTDELEALSSARCRVFRKSNNKRSFLEPIYHHPMGPQNHSSDAINNFGTSVDKDDSRKFTSFKDRLYHLQKTEKNRICFGKSGIHGWGLFAQRNIHEGEMES